MIPAALRSPAREVVLAGANAALSELGLRGRDPPCRFGCHRDAQIGHAEEVDAMEGGLIGRDFRKRDEKKLADGSV